MPELIGDLEFLTTLLLKGAPGEQAIHRAIHEIKLMRAALMKIRDDGVDLGGAGCAAVATRVLEQQVPQAFAEAKKERDEGWPEERS